MEIQNGKIERTTLGYEDHGILSAMIFIAFGGSVQGFGGWRLDTYDRATYSAGPSKACGLWIQGVLRTLGVDSWEKLPGTPIRVRRDAGGLIDAIGHYMEDRWFVPAEAFADLNKAEWREMAKE